MYTYKRKEIELIQLSRIYGESKRRKIGAASKSQFKLRNNGKKNQNINMQLCRLKNRTKKMKKKKKLTKKNSKKTK